MILFFTEIIDSFEKENVVLKKKNLELQEQIAVLEKAVKTLSEDKHKSKLNEVEKGNTMTAFSIYFL